MAAQTPDPLLVNTMISITPVKLDSSTYLVWHRQMLHMAECFDLQGFLDGSAVAPPPSLTSAAGVSSPNPAYLIWRMKDRKLLFVIWTSLSAEAMSEVIESSSSHSAWSTLQAAFSDSSVSRTHQLREELLFLRRGAQSIEEYGQKFKGLCDQLSAINRPVDDSDKGHWFLCRLGSQYTSFADTRLALTPVPVFRDLLHQAKQFESMLRAMDGIPTSSAAFSAERGRSGNGQNTGGGRIPAWVSVLVAAVDIIMAEVVETPIQILTMEIPVRLRIQVVVRVVVLTYHGVRYAMGITMQTSVPNFSMPVMIFLLHIWLRRSKHPVM